MGRLVGLELNNFKSYKGTCSIGFGTSCFTSIIGPNGAGKSNMMDAISFVLGVQSSQLRSHNMKDLIYRGALGDPNIDQGPDPKRAYVMIIYETDNGERIELKRSINSSGSTEYRLDNKAVTSLQYSSFLKQENILIKARNFLVFQGDVESIASQNAKDLTKLIENISGSNELSQEFDQLKEEMDNAHEFTNSVFARKRTLNSESKHYKEQMAEQELFTRKLLDKSNLVKIINLYKLYHNEISHNQLIGSVKVHKIELKALQKKLTAEEKKHSSLVKEYSKGNLEMKNKLNNKAELVKDLEVQNRKLIPINSSKKAVLTKINTTKQKIKDITNEITNQEGVIHNLESKLKEINKLYRNFQHKIDNSNTNIASDAHDEYDKLRAEFLSNGGSDFEEKLSLLLNQKDTIEEQIDNLRNQIHTYSSSIKDQELVELNNRETAINLEINDILSTKEEKLKLKEKLTAKIEECNNKELNVNIELREVLVKLDELQSKQRESNRQRKLRDNLLMLKNVLPEGSIKGFVYELIRPSHVKYQQALSTILGKNIDAIIVETSAVAYKCIEILKEKRAGIATFIPLDVISSDGLNLNYLRSIHPQAQPGVDIVEYDDSNLEQAVQYVIGDCLVTETLSVSRQLKWNSHTRLENKLVSLDGSVINRSGLMTGGVNNQYNTNISWDKNELKKLSEVKDQLMIELNKINDTKPKEIEINILNESILELEDTLPIVRNQKETVARLIKDKQTEIEFKTEKIQQINNSIGDLTTELQKVDNDISQVNLEITAISKGIFKEFCKKYKFHNIKEYEEIHGVSIRAKTKERSQFIKAISTLTNELKFEKSILEDLIPRKDNLEKSLKELDYQYNEILETKETFEVELDKLIADHQILEEDISEFEIGLNDKLKKANEIEGNIGEIKIEITNKNNSITNIEESLLKVDIERISILKNCKIENILIPLKDGFIEQISLDENLTILAQKVYEIEVDYELLNDNLRASFNSRIEAELKARLDSIIEELEQLTPNSKASDRLKETEIRLRDFDRDFTTARQAENKIIEKFNKVKTERHEKFIKAFDHISGKIDSIYKELTRTNSSPLGGSAYLTLEDEDEPYLYGIKYHAMPPMKRFRDMELLSGGEKTIAALALLFAIHSYQPSPFFVLDEVDAALDSSNVNKIANYIKNTSSPTFQFIVISLKNTLFEKSDALVGIYREQGENSSRTVSLDLRDYPEGEIVV